jgi:hypothetical protein
MKKSDFSFIPLYKDLYTKSDLLTERFDSEMNSLWENYVIIDFDPYSTYNSQVLAFSLDYNRMINSSYIPEVYKEYSYKFHIISNNGSTDGSEISDWIYGFYNKKNKYYEQNIYSKKSKDIHIYAINKSFKKRVKINLISCIPKDPIFYFRRKSLKKQISVTLEPKTIKNISNTPSGIIG